MYAINRHLATKRDLTELTGACERTPATRPGVRFVRQTRADLESGASGFDWEPKGHLHPFLEVSNTVRKEFTYPSFNGH